MEDISASLNHLRSINDKAATLMAAAFDTSNQLVAAIQRGDKNDWCTCRLEAVLSGLVDDENFFNSTIAAASANRMADQLGLPPLEQLKELAVDCECIDLWLSGEFPVTETLPLRPGVYVCFDEQDRAAYIGTSRVNVKSRLQAHFRDPEKPILVRWAAFFPGVRGESAAVWEIRLIEQHQPYLNRAHVNTGPDVRWEPQGDRGVPGPSPWYDTDPDYQWFKHGPGRWIGKGELSPWQIAKIVTNLTEAGIDRELIEEACLITASKDLDNPVPYMSGVARNLAKEAVA